MNILPKKTRRILGVAKVVARHGISHFSRRFLRRDGESSAVRFRMILEELGPLFVKFGQIMSTRPDLLPPQYLRELSKLQDEVSPFDPKKAMEIVEMELKKSISELFENFSPRPMASASLAQVHKATLNSGEEVAVKVRRPKIADQIEEDMETLYYLAMVLTQYIKFFSKLRLVEAVVEFKRIIQMELDFSSEAKNTNRLREELAGNYQVKIPRVYYSTSRLIVLEWIKGIKIGKKEKLLQAGYEPAVLTHIVTKVWIDQIFKNGVFHADPHPGNILVLNQRKIGLVDMGVVGELNKEDRKNMKNLLHALLQRDIEQILEILTKMEIFNRSEDEKELKKEISNLLDRYYGKKLREINPANLIYEIMSRLFRKYEIDPPIRFITLAKTLLTLEAVCEDLDPNFDWSKVLKENFGPIYLREIISSSLINQLMHLINLPKRVDRVLQMIEEGEIKISPTSWDKEVLSKAYWRWGSNISSGLVTFSLILGSTLLMLENVGPLWKGISILGLLGYFTGGVLGILLLTKVFVSDKI